MQNMRKIWTMVHKNIQDVRKNFQIIRVSLWPPISLTELNPDTKTNYRDDETKDEHTQLKTRFCHQKVFTPREPKTKKGS